MFRRDRRAHNLRSHIAILNPKYLDLIISGKKSIECRLTRIPCPPFGLIDPGEKILLKQSAGPLKASARAQKIISFNDLTPKDIVDISRRYNKYIQADPQFYQDRLDCKYCTLVWLENVKPIAPFRIFRKGMQAWIVCKSPEDLEALKKAPKPQVPPASCRQKPRVPLSAPPTKNS